MSPSRPFILRPVATSLLMAAILLAGGGLPAASGFRAAAGGLSDDSGADVLSRRESRRDGFVGDHAAGAAIRPGARAQPDDFDELLRGSLITLQFVLDLNIDVAEQQVQAAINAAERICLPIFRTRRFTARPIRPTLPSSRWR